MTKAIPPPVLPWDTHNQTLVSNVHPPDWTNPAPAARYNLVVIGGGTAGLVTAAGAAGLGAKVALVEKHFDLRPKGIIQSLDLLRPIYTRTAAHGHFGRDEPDFTWENTDKAAALKADAGTK